MSLRHPRLRTVLLTVSLLILLVPLAGVAILRIYEAALVRRTERQLIGQAAIIAEVYRSEYRRVSATEGEESAAPGRALPEDWTSEIIDENGLRPIEPQLDISSAPIYPPAPESVTATAPPEHLAALAGERIAPVLEKATRVTLAGVRVVDAQGVVVASSGSERGRSIAGREEVSGALAGRHVSLLRQRVSDDPAPPLQSVSRGQRYRVFVALPVIEDRRVIGAVVLSRTPLDVAKALYLNRRALAILAGSVIAVVLLVSALTSLTISRPVRELIRQAEAITRGERGAVEALGRPGTLELAQLSEALASMSRALSDRAEYIRTFASHVSHEFKTPLTTIQGTVELLHDHWDEMPSDQRETFLANLADASGRLERLVARLLELARADVLEPGNQSCEVDEVLERTRRRHADRGLATRVEPGRNAGRARIAADTLGEILSNLLDNARQHAGDGVEVTLAARRVERPGPPVVELRIADNGPGISAANASRVFTPFFTTARDRGGSGMGLSIVRSLLAAHGATIELAADEPGASFLMRIPAAEPDRSDAA
jgi:signal transduction histidine kinase